MSMKKFSLLLVFVLLLGVFATACGEDEEEVPPPVQISGVEFMLGTGMSAPAYVTLLFYDNGTYVMHHYSELARSTLVRTFEGDFDDTTVGAVTITDINRTFGTTDGFSTLTGGWTLAYTPASGASVADATGFSSITYNNGANTFDAGPFTMVD
jgi:hypothetical protein